MPPPGTIDAEFWGTFPVRQVPRPVVLVDQAVRIAGFDGVRAKQAWLHGAVESRVDLPTGVLDLLVPSRRRYDGSPVVVTAVDRTEASFRTDRGVRQFPAYRVTAIGMVEPCIVLDPAVSRWWPRPNMRSVAGHGFVDARIAGDHRTIEIIAMGGVRTQFHGAEFEEHRAFVVARGVTTERPVPPGTIIEAVGVGRPVTGRLDEPLGARVLLTAWGEPFSVVPTSALVT